MADSPENSPPASTTPGTNAASPSDGLSPPSPPSNESSPPSTPSNGSSPPSPESSSSAPPPNDGSASSSPPAPSQDNSPPPSSPPPSNDTPPPRTPGYPQPSPSEGSSPETPPAPPAPDSSSRQSPPQSPLPPSQGSNDDRNKDGDQNNNNNNGENNNNNSNNNNNNNNNNNDNGNGNNRDVFSPPPPQPRNRNSDDGGPSPPRSLGPPRNGGGSESSGNNNSPNIPGIIGIAVGAGLLLLFVILLCICCKKKKKKKRQAKFDHMSYYNNSPFGNGTGGGVYYNNVPPQEQYGRDDHVVNMTSPGGVMGANWGTTQSPQPPVSGGQGSNSDSSNLTGRNVPLSSPPHPSMVLGFNKSTFSYDELAVATQGFSDSNLLGQGGFGYVHKGVLPDGKEVAVKSLKVGSGQGEREFQAEIEIISRVHHRYLVSLVGYCIAGSERLLVYEFLPNNTLEFHLHGKGRPVMDWPTRMKIALGSAKGLAYLHEDCHPRIIHRDIKAANILLDFSFEAKVADFGLAKLSQDNYTHVSTRVMGTFGYLAPEYASSGKLSDKSDVFSFGVMLLELITGRPPVDLTGEMEDTLVDWARHLCQKAALDGDYNQLADPRLERNYDQHEMAKMAACAAAAIRHSARRRPKMSQIVRALEADVSMDDITEGVRPGQSTYLSPSSGSSEYDASSYSADMRKFRKLALDSKNYQSSEFGHTSEYGLNPSASSSEEMHRNDERRTVEL